MSGRKMAQEKASVTRQPFETTRSLPKFSVVIQAQPLNEKPPQERGLLFERMTPPDYFFAAAFFVAFLAGFAATGFAAAATGFAAVFFGAAFFLSPKMAS